MEMRNQGLDVIAVLCCELGNSWEKEEYSVSMQTIGIFDISFAQDFSEAVQEWVAENEETLKHDCIYQLYMAHTYEHDGAGATTARYFQVINVAYDSY